MTAFLFILSISSFWNHPFPMNGISRSPGGSRCHRVLPLSIDGRVGAGRFLGSLGALFLEIDR